MALQNDFRGGECGKPDPFKLMLGLMRTNPIVNRIVTAPAQVASQIELYPVHGAKSGRRRRADPNGTAEERYAWSAWSGYVDDCGSQSNLIRRHFEAKLSTGAAVQIKYTTDTGRVAYEIVQNAPHLIEYKNGQWIWHPNPGEDVLVAEVREVYAKGFEYTGRAHSSLMPLCEHIALWELVMDAIGEGVQTDLLLGGVFAMPSINPDDHKWKIDWANWIKEAKNGGRRMPWPMAYPVAAGAPSWLSPDGTIQDNLLKVAELLLDNIASFGPMDAALLKEGMASGTHWNGILRQRDNLQSFIVPTLRLDVLNDVLAWPFRPLLEDNDLGLTFDLDDWDIEVDWQKAINQPDQGKNTIDLVKCGQLKQRALCGVGYDLEDLLTPDDPEWEWVVERQRVFGKATAEEEPPQPGGPGSETFGAPPSPEADNSDQPNPTQRSQLVGAGAPVDDGWNVFGEW